MYTNFNYYLNIYSGTIEDDEQFDRLLKRAVRTIDRVTFGRLKPDGACPFSTLDSDEQEAVQWATCEVIDKLNAELKSDGRKVVRVSNDGYEETYADDGKSTEGRILIAAIQALPSWMTELDADWRLP